MKNKKTIAMLVISTTLLLTGCASTQRAIKDTKSSITGLNRRVEVLNYQGDVIRTYEGKIDVQSSDTNSVKFDLNGDRVIIYNAPVIIEEIE